MESIVLPADTRLATTSWLAKFFNLCGLVAILCLGYWAYGWSQDSSRAIFSYFFSYMSVLSIVLGSLIFVLIQHATRAGWSVVVRRIPETAMAITPLFVVLFIPIAFSIDSIFSWTSIAADDHVLLSKAPYLNKSFFLVRSVAYLCVWVLLSIGYYRWSTAQDGGKNPHLTKRMWWCSPLAIISFGLTVSFAGFDWLMSLQPHWFSTIFGVYFFAGCMLAGLAFIILMCMALQSCGALRTSMTTEHYHDLGKLLFGFTVFWSYIAFCQFMLIWYANMPEETEFYLHRLHHGWEYITWLLPLTNFFIPFFILMSRHAKRNKLVLGVGCVWIMLTHFVDIYWLVLPAFKDSVHGMSHFHVDFGDVTCLIGLTALFLWCFGFMLKGRDVIPTGDSRLGESLSFENF